MPRSRVRDSHNGHRTVTQAVCIGKSARPAVANRTRTACLARFELCFGSRTTDSVAAERLLEPVTPDADAHGDDGGRFMPIATVLTDEPSVLTDPEPPGSRTLS